jgi:hypothetical protein
MGCYPTAKQYSDDWIFVALAGRWTFDATGPRRRLPLVSGSMRTANQANHANKKRCRFA